MKHCLILLSALCTSMFFFPFEFSFLRGINTKHIMAGLGFVFMFMDFFLERKIVFSKELVFSSLIAIVFSFVGLYSTDYNNTNDYAYSFYIISMWIWYLACYGACIVIRLTHGYISIRLIVNYLLTICVAQCIIALLIDFIPAFKFLIDGVFISGDLRLINESGRLYGIGALLDFGGVRFATVLVCAAVFVMDDQRIRYSFKFRTVYLLGILILCVVGSMIARTTTIGIILAVVYIFYKSGFFSRSIRYANLLFWRNLLTVLVVVILILTYLYKTNEQVYVLLRFAFEGFFTWVETGVWKTSSTEILKNMWVFPDNNKTWIIGDGYFDNPNTYGFYMGTDVGYLRFIYYSGLIGLICFCFFFIYLSASLSIRFSYIRNLFILLLVVVFVNWAKVSTDIFLVYAFFLVISQPQFNKYYRKDFEVL